VVITSEGVSEERLIQDDVLIGRTDPTRGIFPELALQRDPLVSRRHARIRHRNEAFYVADMNSVNGTRLNGQPLQPGVEVPLVPGDTIELGEFTQIQVLRGPAVDPFAP
jgi:pSer/pThr/pTyr-binding forkhead associated (FHA) protein